MRCLVCGREDCGGPSGSQPVDENWHTETAEEKAEAARIRAEKKERRLSREARSRQRTERAEARHKKRTIESAQDKREQL